MGLHVSSVAQIANAAPELRNIKYFVYLLDYYKFSAGVMEAVTSEIPSLEANFARLGDAVLVTSVGNLDFADDVLSWHKVAGKNPAEICPAIFISSLPPSHFSNNPSNEVDAVEYESDFLGLTRSIKAPWIILELGRLCDNKDDVLTLLKRLISDIEQGKPLADFEYTGSHEYQDRPILSGKLNYSGIEFDHKAAFAKCLEWFSDKSSG